VPGFFRVIGTAGVAAEAISARLVEIAERYKALLAEVAPEPGDDAETARLKRELQVALKRTDLARADALLAEILAVQDRELARRALEAAATCATRGEVAMTRLRYREAASHFGAAANRVPMEHEDERGDFLQRQADALYLQGKEFGDNGALRSADNVSAALLALWPRERVPLNWAVTQINLSIALRVLGEHGDAEALRQAVECCEAAREEFLRRTAPAYVAVVEQNLARARVLLEGK
jgi:tetratricopeptide (TPR) repeat protein